MKSKSYFYIFLGVLIFVLSFIVYVYFTKTPYFETFLAWSRSNLILFVTIVLILKIIGVVYPPLPSAIFTIGAIPILGWLPAYLLDLTGSIIAGTIDYFLGKKYGFPLLNKIFDKQVIQKLKNIKIKPNREIESVIVLRTLLGGVLLEAVYYGAGLLNIKFQNFIVGAVVSHAILGVPTFLIGETIFKSRNALISVVISVIALFVAFKLKGRYFEHLSV